MSRARAERGTRIGQLFVAVLLAGRISALAQLPSPRLDSCYPQGACAGSEVEVVLAGADLDDTKALVFDSDKIAAVRIDNLKFRVSVRGDCPRGRYEVRLVGRHGISTPLPFRVDDLCETVNSGSNHSREKADRLSVPQVVHGKCQAEQRDFYRFTAREGERIEIVCAALELDSPMDPVVTVQNAIGLTMARGDDERDRDVHLQFVAPSDGAYFVAVHDKLYAGGATHVYRLSVRDSSVRSRIDPGAGEWSDAGPLRSVIDEAEPNDAPGSAQTITPPVELRGRFDVDWFQFHAEGGKPLWIEIAPEAGTNGRDPLIVVQKVVADGSGAGQTSQVLELDDQPELPAPPLWQFASRDPAGRFVPDVTGIYRLRVNDRSRTKESYRLVIHEATADFSLVVLAESPANEEKKIFRYQPNLRRGGSAYFHVAARRRGYDGEILVRANGLPPGMSAYGSIPAGAPSGIIAFHAAADAPAWAGHIRVVGEGGGVTREARGSHYRWNVENRDNQRVASRAARAALAIVEETAPFAVVAAEEKTWEAPPKGDLEIAVRLERPNGNAKPKGEWELVPIGLPGLEKSAPVKFDAAAANDAKMILPLQRDGNSVAPGTYTLLLRARGTVSYKADSKASVRDVKHVEFSRPIVIHIPPSPAPSGASTK